MTSINVKEGERNTSSDRFFYTTICIGGERTTLSPCGIFLAFGKKEREINPYWGVVRNWRDTGSFPSLKEKDTITYTGEGVGYWRIRITPESPTDEECLFLEGIMTLNDWVLALKLPLDQKKELRRLIKENGVAFVELNSSKGHQLKALALPRKGGEGRRALGVVSKTDFPKVKEGLEKGKYTPLIVVFKESSL